MTPSTSTSTAAASGEPVASTIVDLTADDPRILREGAVTAQQVSDVLGRAVVSA